MARKRRPRSETARNMVCFACLQKITATITQAQKHGWTLWVGGALCKRCAVQTA